MITYISMTTEGYQLGESLDLETAMKMTRDSMETYYFQGDVERLIREIGISKVYNLVRIIHNEKEI